jgi:hypothetical protein
VTPNVVISGIAAALLALQLATPSAPADANSHWPKGKMDGHITPQTHATFSHGRITFMRADPSLDSAVVMVVNPDGTGERQVSPLPLECPHWSPDGRRISTCGNPDGGATAILNPVSGSATLFPMPDPTLFTACYLWTPDARRLACEGSSDSDPTRDGVYTIRSSDGQGLRQLVSLPDTSQVLGDFSPNGRRIVFAAFDNSDDGTGLYVAETDGHHTKQILPTGAVAGSGGSWSPNGNRIIFSVHATADDRQSLWTARPNGSGLTEITIDGIPCGGSVEDPDSVGCNSPVWSPDGQQIAFDVVTPGGSDVYVANRDGSSPEQVSFGDDDEIPDWGVTPHCRHAALRHQHAQQ